MARILIADHLTERRSILCTFLRADEHVILPVSRETEALKTMREAHPDLIILEGTVAGTKLLSEVRQVDSNCAIIMLMAGPPSVEQLVELMNQGVSEVLVSPLDIDDVETKVERALSRRTSADAVQIRFHDLVGSSEKMQQIFRKIVKAAAGDFPVLITGEPGTGKQSVARHIHRLSARRDREFRAAHCEGLAEAELERQIFGVEGGLPGQGIERRQGELELTDGGTLYLQGSGGLSPLIQDKLLRFLDEETFQRIGGGRTLTADVRLMMGTLKPLYLQVEEGQFRHELYYQLSVCEMELPSLRSHPTDIPELVELFLGRYEVNIAGEAMEVLMNYSWPGNIDELKNAVEQAVNVCENNRVELKDLPARVLKSVAAGTRKHKFVPRTIKGKAE